MANNLLPLPTGIDVPISRLQTWLYEQMYVMYGESGLTSSLFEMFGRVYRNSADKGAFLPQWFEGSKDYMNDMFTNDKLAMLMWFGLNDPTKYEGDRATYNISLYCFCNLNLLKPGVTAQRMDEKIVSDLQNLIFNRYGFYVYQTERDVDNVLKKFKGAIKDRAIVDNNMQPFLCFRIDMTNAIDISAFDCSPQIVTPPYFNAMTAPITIQFKDNPDTSLRQTLWNGVKIQVQYPTGTSVTIPHLLGRDVFPDQLLNWQPVSLGYDASTATFTGKFFDNDLLRITYNENQ